MKALTRIIVWVSAIIILIIASGIYTTHYLTVSSERLESHILQLEKGTESEDWKEAGESLAAIKEDWLSTKKVWAILVDHFEIDNIDTTLSKVSKYIEAMDKSPALAEVSTLRQYVKHIPQMQSFSLENVL